MQPLTHNWEWCSMEAGFQFNSLNLAYFNFTVGWVRFDFFEFQKGMFAQIIPVSLQIFGDFY